MPTRQLLLVVFLFGHLLSAGAAENRFLYISTPDGAQEGGRSGNGILIFNMDDGFRFVRRIQIDHFKEGIRGFTGHAKTHRIYYSTTSRRLGCFDVETDRVLWEHLYPLGCDRSSVSGDGSKIYVPTGWWYGGTNSGVMVVDSASGTLLKQITAGVHAHNTITSLDGRYLFLGGETNLFVFDQKDDALARTISGVGEAGVFPFTVDRQNRLAYICLGKHVGFDVVNLRTGAKLYRVFATENPIPHRTHGAGLTPDERELWISDQDGKRLFIFDATQMPPKQVGEVPLSAGGHGWVCFSLDGKYALSHTPDVIDVQTRKVIATLEDETGKPVSSSKFLEVHLRDGKVVEMGNEFGLGRRLAKARSGRF